MGRALVARTKEHPQRTERNPATGLTHGFVEREGERLVVCVIKEPSTIGLPPALDDVHGIPDAHVGLNTGVSEVVERTEDVVVVAGRKRELQERRIRDLAGRKPSQERSFEQVLLASPSRCRDLRRGPDGTLVLK